MDKYKDLLISQYEKATGIENLDTSSEMFISELFEWINRRTVIGDKYINFLKSIRSDFISRDTAEVGKGKFDTLTTNDDIRLITPYLKGENVMRNRFGVFDGIPLLLSDGVTNSFNPIYDISTFMTQNPYTIYDIINWHQLYNYGDYDIIVGMYGNTYDRDREEKIKWLKALKEKLEEPCIMKSENIGDTYYCAVLSNK